MAGTLNFKTKYAPRFPMVRVVWSDIDTPFVRADVLQESGFLGDVMAPSAILCCFPSPGPNQPEKQVLPFGRLIIVLSLAGVATPSASKRVRALSKAIACE
jgi:hypothetical protein